MQIANCKMRIAEPRAATLLANLQFAICNLHFAIPASAFGWEAGK
jgi:hypothetical protein